MISKGIIIYSVCVLTGINIGSLLQKIIKDQLKISMKIIIGLSAMTIGIMSITKGNSLPAIVLSFIGGALIGEIMDLDKRIRCFFEMILKKIKCLKSHNDEYMEFYLIVVVTLCASGTNIFGAITEAISGDASILLSKAVMDLIATIIFASTLGRAMNIIVIPQLIILCFCFWGSHFFAPYITAEMLQNFIAVGGIITLILGMNMAQVKKVKVVNLLPSLLLVWPCSYVFSLI